MFGFFAKRKLEMTKLTMRVYEEVHARQKVERLNVELTDRITELKTAHGKLWVAHAAILEGVTAKPNGTVKKFLKISEQALIDDPIAEIKPEPKWSKGG